ncbi:unnamed protein product [Hapterophycus canaliculatus]
MRVHVRADLQLFCECEDLDETLTNLVSPDSGSSTSTPGGWKRVLAVAQDRARVPWPGGARRVDLAWLIAAALLWLVRVLHCSVNEPHAFAANGLVLVA